MRIAVEGAEPFLVWALFSLIAIALIGGMPQVGLFVALAGGLAMGVSSLLVHGASRREAADKRSERTTVNEE
jgi:hypothetical protein